MIGAPTSARRRRHLTWRPAAAGTAATLLILCLAGPAAGDVLRRAVVDPARAERVHAMQRWHQIVDQVDHATSADSFYVAADAASDLASRVAVAGWSAPEVPGLVAALVATANPDGGYGLARPWDAYQDGTVNPATTSYAATTAGHVGPVLLAGFTAGKVPASAVTRAVDSLLDQPRSYDGRCIAYSDSPADLSKPCVWNVHFGAADWALRAARATGHRLREAQQLATVATSWLAVLPQNPATGYWAYSAAGGAPQDLGHQLWTATAVDSLLGSSDATALMLDRSLWRRQAERFHDQSVAAALGVITLRDCRYGTDPTVLRYAGSTADGSPYTLKVIGARARTVLATCFGTERVGTLGTGPAPGAAPAVGPGRDDAVLGLRDLG